MTSQLADQIARRADGAKAARFDISLDPAGLGKVNVKVQIDAQGQLTAQLAFDNPAAAAEARSRSGDLQQALAQAGFDVSQGGLSFQSSGGQNQNLGFGQDGQGSNGGGSPSARTAQASDDTASTTTPTPVRSTAAGAVDVTI
jgi:flagellar hook-length control protein FliK